MKKLYRNRGAVHPSPPHISDKLPYLPAAILTLTAALTADDKEVLAYLLSCSSSAAATYSGRRRGCSEAEEHPATFSCNCFRCYMSYWVRWDSSPNRQLIHEIIDAFEDWLAGRRKSRKGGKRERRKKGGTGGSAAPDGETKQGVGVGEGNGCAAELGFGEVNELNRSPEAVVVAEEGGGGVEEEEEEEEKGPLGKLVSFIGEKIWGVWE